MTLPKQTYRARLIDVAGDGRPVYVATCAPPRKARHQARLADVAGDGRPVYVVGDATTPAGSGALAKGKYLARFADLAGDGRPIYALTPCGGSDLSSSSSRSDSQSTSGSRSSSSSSSSESSSSGSSSSGSLSGSSSSGSSSSESSSESSSSGSPSSGSPSGSDSSGSSGSGSQSGSNSSASGSSGSRSSGSGSGSGSITPPCCQGYTLPDELMLSVQQIQGFDDCDCLEFSGVTMTKTGVTVYDSDAISECGNSNSYRLNCDTSVTPKKWKFRAASYFCIADQPWILQEDSSSCSPLYLVFRMRTYALNIEGGDPDCGACAPNHTNEGDIILEAVITESV